MSSYDVHIYVSLPKHEVEQLLNRAESDVICDLPDYMELSDVKTIDALHIKLLKAFGYDFEPQSLFFLRVNKVHNFLDLSQLDPAVARLKELIGNERCIMLWENEKRL